MEERHTYLALAADSKSIRVLELQPGKEHEPLECHLVTQSIDHSPYVAISYVWGDPTKDHTINCDGKSLPVTSNLHEVLVALRCQRTVRRLWADAICINQGDVEELGEQVSLMGRIYNCAQSVIGWVGPDTDGTAATVVDHIKHFMQDPQRSRDDFRQQLESGQTDSNSSQAGPNAPVWQAIKDFVERPYFHRVWIIQELGLAAKARLLCGKHEIPWLEFSAFCAFLDHNAAFMVNHLQLQTWVVNHTSMIWLRQPDGGFKHDFAQTIHLARIHQASDPRDRIYAFLSHPTAVVGGELIAKPDYTITTAELYVRFAKTYIQRRRNIQILTLVDHDEVLMSNPLPTWVVDWHAPNRVSMTPGMRNPMPDKDSVDSISFLEADSAKPTLVVQGAVIDTVSAVSPILDDKDFIVTTLEMEMQKNCPFFLDVIWSLLSQQRNAALSVEDLIARLSAALPAGLHKYLLIDNTNIEQHRLDFAAYVRRFESIRPKSSLANQGAFSKFPSEALQDCADNTTSRGNPAQYVQDITWMCKSRVVFCTEKKASSA